MALSIIIPAHNEETLIAAVLSRLHNVLADHLPYEIIVVNNASTDKTGEILASFENVKTVTLDQKRTISAARNLGYRQAQYELLAFIDADVLLTQEWAEELHAHTKDFKEHPGQITGCRYSLSEQPSWVERVWFQNMRTTNLSYINSGNLITTQSVMRKIGGFNEDLITGEDVDFCRRAQKEGIDLRINPNYKAHHEGYPQTLTSFFKRERWHGVGDLVSLRSFISSKVAVFSFSATALLTAAIILLLTGKVIFGLGVLVAFIAVNAYAILARFHVRSFIEALSLFYLHIVYCFARTTSFLAGRHR